MRYNDRPRAPRECPVLPRPRAWLNGFFAGLLGLEAGGSHAQGNGNGNGATLATSPAEVEEDFPWHDPALPLAERLELAEGRPYPRRLMAAMAQLDCGACGYLCKTYSEAIARGEEKDLNRCTPGGKETSRKLKELVAAQGAVTTNGAAMTSVVAGNGSIAATTGGAPLSSVVVRPTFIPYAAMSETSSNCWKFSVINEASCWEYVVDKPSRTSWMAA